jgi:hypothetical protein
MDYQEMYNQAMGITGATSGATNPLAPTTTRPNTQLYDFARGVPNTLQPLPGTDYFGRSPRRADTPSSLLGGTAPQTDLNAPIANLTKSLPQIQQEAEARYLEMAAQQRDVARQGTLRAGADQYSQARMAMEQQMALSDTRGLTAGAREGAQQTLSATQQVALNQIESATMNQLLQINAQSLQDPLVAQEFAAKSVELAKMNNPLLVTNEGILQRATMAREDGNTVEANRLMDQYFENVNTTYGSSIPTGDGTTPEMIDQALVEKISRLANEPTVTDEMWGWATAILAPTAAGVVGKGAAATVGGLLASAGGAIKGGGLLATVGKSILVGAGTVLGAKVIAGIAIAGAVIWAGSQIVKQIETSTKGEASVATITRELANERTRLRGLGYTPETIDLIIDAIKEQAALPPKYDNIG